MVFSRFTDVSVANEDIICGMDLLASVDALWPSKINYSVLELSGLPLLYFYY